MLTSEIELTLFYRVKTGLGLGQQLWGELHGRGEIKVQTQIRATHQTVQGLLTPQQT